MKLSILVDKAVSIGRVLLGQVRDLLQGETLMAINFGAIIVIYLSWHLALAAGWSHVAAPTLDVIVLAVGSASTAVATFARRFVSSPATVGTLEAVIEYWRGLYAASRDNVPPAAPADASPTPDPTTPDPAAAAPITDATPAPDPTPDPALNVPAADAVATPAEAASQARTQCPAINAYGGACVLDLGHAGDHVTASGSSWPNEAVAPADAVAGG